MNMKDPDFLKMHVTFAYKDWELHVALLLQGNYYLFIFKERIAGKLLAE